MPTTTRGAAAAVGDNPVLETGARVGYAANGVLHLLIAWLALQIAWGGSGGEADQSGAFGTLAGTPLGSALLWAVAIGFVLLGVWQLTEAVVRRDIGDRVKAVGKAAVYLALSWTAISVVQGSSSDSSDQASDATARLMAQPFGRVLVAIAGLVVIGVAVYHVVKGWRRKFLEDLREQPGPRVVQLGRVGYIAKGVALGILGGLLLAAGATGDPERAQGLDGALRTLLELPLGKVLLTLAALGLAAYGLYSFARARYARV